MTAQGFSAPTDSRGLGKEGRGRKRPGGLDLGSCSGWVGGKERGSGGRFVEKFRRSGGNKPKFCRPKWEQRWSSKLGIG